MKKNLKLMTAAMSLVALASCTDDLNVNGSQNGVYGKDDFVATLQLDEAYTRFAMQEESDKVKGGSKKVVWSDQDQIRVFTLDKLSQDLYEIKSGAGEATAVFQRIADSGLTGEKYAITEATSIYGISATRVDGKDLPLLTVTLPGEYTAGDDGQGNKLFPVPYWGKVTSMSGTDANTNISASFTGLAAFLRVGLDELPAGTRAIVLTTHGDRTGNHPTEGFQISPDFPRAGTVKKDVQEESGTNYWADHTAFPVTTGGKSEAISGTLNAILDPSKERNDVFLQVDDRLVKSDTLRVNLRDENGLPIYADNQVFYIPIVVGTYENLHVLAVTGDSKYSYTWVGTELKNFKNETFVNNKAYYLDMNLHNFATADLGTLNQYIKQKNATAGVTTVINVDDFVADDGVANPGFSNTQLNLTGAGNLIINFKTMSTTSALNIAEGETSITASETPTVEYNFDPTFTHDVTINSKLRKAIIGTVGGVNSNAFDITVTGPANKYVMGLDIYDNIENYKYMVMKESALTIKNGFKKVTVSAQTAGDIYVFSDGEETEVLELDVQSTYNNDIRVSSALVSAMKIADVADGVRKIWTDGSAAMKTIQNQAGSGYPLNTEIESYYTGAGLTNYAFAQSYDQENIYTVAQLQSHGAKDREIDGTTVTNPYTGATYKIPNAIVGHFWLGSKDYKWIGPEVTKDDYELDGENSALMNMYVETDGSTGLYIDDPHYCCTSCGLPATDKTLSITQDLGLIRSIVNSATAKVENVNLNDVYINSTAAINNIGAIVGRVEVTGDFDFNNNALGEVKIDVNGNNVGGMIGKVKAAKLTVNNNNSTNTKNDGGYVISDKDYVGGLIGNAESTDAVTMNGNTVVMQNNVEAGKGYAAGMVGSLTAADAINAKNNKVDIAEITAVEKYAAGLVGKMESTGGAAIFDRSDVTVKTVSTDDKYAGGLIGQAKVPAANGLYLRNSTVAITTELAAEEGEVGGLLGNAQQAVRVAVNNNTTVNQNTTVTIAKLTGAYAAGGILGSNNTNVPLIVYTGHSDAAPIFTNAVNVTVTAYNNPKSATYFVGGDRYKYGTMQDVIGFKQANVTIYNDKLTVSGNLTDAAKKAIFYDAHVDGVHTTTAGEFYWGDTKGYVGFGYTGAYTLSDAADYTGGAPVLSEQENGYNYFKAY